jgi:hypothetical protein
MLNLLNKKYKLYYNKHSVEFNSIPRNLDEVSFSPCNNIINKEADMKTRTNFDGYYKFCVIKLFGKDLFHKDFKSRWFKYSHTHTYNRQYNVSKDTKFGIINDFILGAFLYNYIISLNKYTGDKKMVIWPLSGFRKKESKFLVGKEKKIYNDIKFPNLLPRDSERLVIILSIIDDPVIQIDFINKFYNINFKGLNSYSLIDWTRNNYPNKRRFKHRRYY